MRLKTLLVLAVCLFSASAFAQSPEATKYAPRAVLLLDATPGVEAVMPMVFIENGQQHLEFISASKIKESMGKGGKPIYFGEVLAALNEATTRINQLQAENDKLWKVAVKDAPKSEVVVVQSPAPAGPSQAELGAAQANAEANARRQLAMQMFLGMSRQPASQPYKIPMPVNPNSNRLQTNCITYRIGDMTHTSCN